MNQLEHIQPILPQTEYEKLIAIEQEITDAWNKRQIFRTETEAEYSVLNDYKFPTNASKYWQSVREQMVHFDELVRLSFNLRRKKIDLAECLKDLEQAERYKKERLEIDKDELLFDIKCLELYAKDRVREIMMWSHFKKKYNDGSFDDKNVNTHQKESLFRSVLNRAQLAQNVSTEESLSINGILNMLKDEPVNKNFIENIKEKK